MKIKFALLATAAALSFNSQASTTNWSAHDPLELAAAITAVGAFEDSYLFSLSDPSGIFSTTVSNNLTTMLGISGGQVSLYKESGAVDIAIGSFAFDGSSGNISHAFGEVASGSYYYLVGGTGTGTMGGFYTLTSTVSAVPEPETYALLLVGLAALGFLRSRRAE